MGIKVISEVKIYELDGNDVSHSYTESASLEVYSHWNRKDMVVLHVKGHKFTVLVDDLKRAIENAGNTKPY